MILIYDAVNVFIKLRQLLKYQVKKHLFGCSMASSCLVSIFWLHRFMYICSQDLPTRTHQHPLVSVAKNCVNCQLSMIFFLYCIPCIPSSWLLNFGFFMLLYTRYTIYNQSFRGQSSGLAWILIFERWLLVTEPWIINWNVSLDVANCCTQVSCLE